MAVGTTAKVGAGVVVEKSPLRSPHGSEQSPVIDTYR
jgi:hypothetical protein